MQRWLLGSLVEYSTLYVMIVTLSFCYQGDVVTNVVLDVLTFVMAATLLYGYYKDILTKWAHETWFSGDLLDAGVNRSPSAYLNNPAEERSKYKYNVDKEMTLIKFIDDEVGLVGSFNWFATHGTSTNNNNNNNQAF
jgi:hypothetical protein